jgi:hypothetical protein
MGVRAEHETCRIEAEPRTAEGEAIQMIGEARDTTRA